MICTDEVQQQHQQPTKTLRAMLAPGGSDVHLRKGPVWLEERQPPSPDGGGEWDGAASRRPRHWWRDGNTRCRCTAGLLPSADDLGVRWAGADYVWSEVDKLVDDLDLLVASGWHMQHFDFEMGHWLIFRVGNKQGKKCPDWSANLGRLKTVGACLTHMTPMFCPCRAGCTWLVTSPCAPPCPCWGAWKHLLHSAHHMRGAQDWLTSLCLPQPTLACTVHPSRMFWTLMLVLSFHYYLLVR